MLLRYAQAHQISKDDIISANCGSSQVSTDTYRGMEPQAEVFLQTR